MRRLILSLLAAAFLCGLAGPLAAQDAAADKTGAVYTLAMEGMT